MGLTEQQARDQGLEVRPVAYGTGDVPRRLHLGNGVSGTSQLVIDEHRRVIVGSTFIGPGIQELVHSATIAIVGPVTLEQLWHAVPADPAAPDAPSRDARLRQLCGQWAEVKIAYLMPSRP